MKQSHIYTGTFKCLTQYIVFFFMTLSCQSILAEADQDPFWDALTGGKVDFSARYRFEHVDDNAAADQADASTIRTTLGYTTGSFHGFGMRLMAYDVRDVFVDDLFEFRARCNLQIS